jgi:hypothetical protein
LVYSFSEHCWHLLCAKPHGGAGSNKCEKDGGSGKRGRKGKRERKGKEGKRRKERKGGTGREERKIASQLTAGPEAM